jgi:hypothetical protein
MQDCPVAAAPGSAYGSPARSVEDSIPMGKVFSEIDERNAGFIRKQQLFFVATAPAGSDGFVNCSPKGLESFAILDPLTVAYLDLTGSGAETIAHVRQNGRITFLFCAFEGAPRLLRLYGEADVVEPADTEWDALCAHFPSYDAARSIIRAKLTRIADSCGYGVPQYRFDAERSQLAEWAERKGPQGVAEYKREHNAKSLDGLPALRQR